MLSTHEKNLSTIKDNTPFRKFKAWLKKSGIRYFTVLPGHKLYHQEMVDSLNPFDVVTQGAEYPTAKIIRESFWHGILDTWYVLIGDHYDVGTLYDSPVGHGRVGILDLLIFPLISRRFLSMAHERDKFILFRIIFALLGVALEIPRILLGSILTIVLSPMIVIVHFFAYFKSKGLYQQVCDLLLDVRHTTFSVKGDNIEKDVKNILDHRNNYVSFIDKDRLYIMDHNILDRSIEIIQHSARVTIVITEEILFQVQALFKLNLFQISRRANFHELYQLITYPRKARLATVEGMKILEDNKLNSEHKLSTTTVLLNLIFDYSEISERTPISENVRISLENTHHSVEEKEPELCLQYDPAIGPDNTGDLDYEDNSYLHNPNAHSDHSEMLPVPGPNF